jgi:hypothetical protein
MATFQTEAERLPTFSSCRIADYEGLDILYYVEKGFYHENDRLICCNCNYVLKLHNCREKIKVHAKGCFDTVRKKAEISENKSNEILELRKENEYLRMKCILCKQIQIQILVLPCRHLQMCKGCAEINDICPTCNETILGTVRVYIC